MAGALKLADIPPERLAALNGGAPPSNLTECLAVDFAVLMEGVLGLSPEAVADMRDAASLGITKRMAIAADIAAAHGVPVADLAAHPSDSLRGWACYAIAAEGGPLEAQLTRLRPLADDPHFGVREWAWLALRPALSAQIETAIALLTPWTADAAPNIRRFASEATRPRGVWSAHIAKLKETPELGLPLLEPLKADPERYVQDSVANWLNDAAKTRPDWVRALCAEWADASDSKATAYICKRAQRSLKDR
ncbi:DNA alkylation repair protein [Paracoccaceae bacterium GXU_MW_L88]